MLQSTHSLPSNHFILVRDYGLCRPGLDQHAVGVHTRLMGNSQTSSDSHDSGRTLLDRSEVDLNLELHLRSLQIIVAAKIGRDIEPRLAFFDSLLKQADYAGWGVAIATAGLAIHLVWKFSALAEQVSGICISTLFLQASPKMGHLCRLAIIRSKIMALMSAHTCNSDTDVDAWLDDAQAVQQDSASSARDFRTS